jgi:hypothetical protein
LLFALRYRVADGGCAAMKDVAEPFGSLQRLLDALELEGDYPQESIVPIEEEVLRSPSARRVVEAFKRQTQERR